MPPEPFPWDRKEFFRDRKHGHDRSEPFGPGSGSRWRDYGGGCGGGGGSHRNSSNNIDFSPRWGFPSDFRRPPGHGKQDGWHMYHEDYPAARSGDRILYDDSFRPAIPRGDGRYGRFYRENRSSYGQKEWRYHWEPNHHRNMLQNTPSRPRFVNEQRSVGCSPMRVSNPHSDPSDQLPSKEQADKTNDANGSSTGQKPEKENSSGSREWKPLKWSRSGSLTSRGFGYSHSSGSKNNEGESNDMKVDSSPKNVSPLQSPSDNAVAGTPSGVPSEETSSRKKPRLGWGEGLAKYEKKKVDVPEENATKVENAASLCVEPTNTPTSYLVDKSPRLPGFSDCSSPATPSSFACSSSPGLEDKTFVKTADADTNNCSASSMPVSENQLEESHFNLEKLELNSISNLSSLLNELLQASEQYPADSAFVKSSALNKLLLWKGDISKELESTETEIDSLENELKSLNSDSKINLACPASLDSSPVDCEDGPPGDVSMIPRPPPLEVGSSGDMIVDEMHIIPCDGDGEAQTEDKDREINSPGTATSEFSEPLAVPKSPAAADLTIAVTQNFDMRIDIEKTEGSSSLVDDEQDACCSKDDNICDAIINSNKELAASAFEDLFKVSTSYDCCVNSLEANRAPCNGVDLAVRDKFLRKKQFLKFKEKVIALKYRVFQHQWKKDLLLLSLKSQRMKVQKKNDLGWRILHGGIQKHRSSIRSRFSLPAGSVSRVPTADIISYTGKLLSESPAKVYRSSLKMPAMILDEKEKAISRFVSSNGFVEDPCAIEKETALINPWTIEEKEIFLKQFANHGKDFSKIASCLDHKTTADCIQFYYKNHKSDWFVKTKKKPVIMNNPYLMTSGNRWSREMNAASLDILGAASVMAAQADEAMEPSTSLSGKSSSKKSKVLETVFESSGGNRVPDDERETAAADVLAGICGSLSSEAMSSCITSAIEQQKMGPSSRRPLTPEVTQNVDGGDTCSDESCGEMDPIDWTDDEKSLFVQAFSSHGKDFVMISRCVQTKSRDQCKVFFSKARKCLGLDNLQPGKGGAVPVNINANGGGSDAEDTGIVENDSLVCSDKSDSRMDEDPTFVNQDVSKPEALSTEADVAIRVEDINVSQGEDQPVSEGDTSKVGCLRDGVAAEVGAGVLGITTDPVVGECSNEKSTNKLEGEANVPSLPIDVRVSADVWCQPSTTGDNSRYSFSGDSMINRGEPSPSLKSSPLDLPTKVDTSARSFQNCYIRKCNQTPSQNVAGEVPLLAKSEARSDNHAGSSSSKGEKPARNGDVKLFGKILRKPSSVNQPTPPSACDSDGTKRNKFDMNLAINHDMDDHNSFLGLENVPIRSYGFWDGTKIQTGFPSLPDSAMLLAKYSSAFSSYPATVNVDECNLNGACVFSPRELNNTPNQEKVQPFSLDLNPRQETRNGFDGVSGISQHGKGLVKLNGVQGSCTSVSDPVTALKLHYARSQPYGGGGGGNGIVREERR